MSGTAGGTAMAYYRSEFKDDESRKRDLIRLWFRAAGRRSDDG
ncbi:MAG: hypothetical protein ABW020_12020 [Candidatus Rokuibacteriota bacterium]